MPTPRLRVGAAGWIAGVKHEPSPNCDARPEGTAIELLVVHNISLPPGEFGGTAIAELFANRLDCTTHPFFADLVDVHVSAHFLVDRVHQILRTGAMEAPEGMGMRTGGVILVGGWTIALEF